METMVVFLVETIVYDVEWTVIFCFFHVPAVRMITMVMTVVLINGYGNDGEWRMVTITKIAFVPAVVTHCHGHRVSAVVVVANGHIYIAVVLGKCNFVPKRGGSPMRGASTHQ